MRARQFFEGRPAANQDDAVLASRSAQKAFHLGRPFGRDPLPEQIVLVAIRQRVLQQFDLDIRQGILEVLQAGFNRGHFISDQGRARGPIKRNSLFRRMASSRLTLPSSSSSLMRAKSRSARSARSCCSSNDGEGLVASACSILEDLCLELEKLGRAPGAEAFEGVVGELRLALFGCGLPSEVAFLSFRFCLIRARNWASSRSASWKCA